MEKDKSSIVGGGGGGGDLPPSSIGPSYALSSGSLIPVKCDATSSSFSQDADRFSHDISRMPDYPSRNVGHRRAHSEVLSLPDDINFDSDLGVVGFGEGPSLSDDTEEDLLSMYLDIDKFASSSAMSGLDLSGTGSLTKAEASAHPLTLAEDAASASNFGARHHHSQSMDESTSSKLDTLSSGTEGMSLHEAKKSISAAKLADLALVDPKRAKRIWANRQSAARSKERKMRYIAELERKIQTLHAEAATLSTQLTLLQRDNTGLNAESSELKLRLQTMEQQVHLQDALNDSLREEVQCLKIATGQGIPTGGQMMNFLQSSFGGSDHQYYRHPNHAMQPHLAAQQLQQIHIHPENQQRPQHQLQMYQQYSSNDLKMKGVMSLQTQRERSPSQD